MESEWRVSGGWRTHASAALTAILKDLHTMPGGGSLRRGDSSIINAVGVAKLTEIWRAK